MLFDILPYMATNLAIAFVVGLIFGYFIGKGRKERFKTIKTENDTEEESQAKAKFKMNPIFNKNSTLDYKPMVLSSSAKMDNLKKIKGINSQIEKKLHNLGIFHYEQIANWSSKNIEWVESFLELPNYVRNNQWLDQSIILKNGNETTYSQQVENGEIEVD